MIIFNIGSLAYQRAERKKKKEELKLRKHSKSSVAFSKRILSLLIVLAIAVSMFTVVSIASASSSDKYYLDITNNTDWKPASGEKLYATFTKSDSNQTGSAKEFSTVTANKLYKVTDVPTDAAKIQVYLVRSGSVMLDNVPKSNKKRVFFNNTKANWTTPYIYSWIGAGDSDATRNAAWPGAAMTKITGTN